MLTRKDEKRTTPGHRGIDKIQFASKIGYILACLVCVMICSSSLTIAETNAKSTNRIEERAYTYSGNAFVLPHRKTRGRQIQILTFSKPSSIGPLQYVNFNDNVRIGIELWGRGFQPTGKILLIGNDNPGKAIISTSSYLDVHKSLLASHALSSSWSEAIARGDYSGQTFHQELNVVDSTGHHIRLDADDILSKAEQKALNACLWLPKVISIYSRDETVRFSILLPQRSNGCHRFSEFSGSSAALTPPDFAIDDKEIVFKTVKTATSIPLSVRLPDIKKCRYLIDYDDYRGLVTAVIDESRETLRKEKAAHPTWTFGGSNGLGIENEIEKALRAFVNSPQRGGLDGCQLKTI